MSNLGASFRALPPFLVAHRCSCCGKSPGGNHPDIHTCTRHECWHTLRVGNAHLWRTHPHLQELRRFLASLGLLSPWQPSLESQGLPFPPPSPAVPTYTGPINSFETGWTRPIWATHSVGVPCGERRDRARTGWQRDNQAVLMRDEMGGAKRSEVCSEVQSQPLHWQLRSKVGCTNESRAQKPFVK